MSYLGEEVGIRSWQRQPSQSKSMQKPPVRFPRHPTRSGKLQLLLRLRLKELTIGPVRSRKEVMDEIGTQAESLGLTPEILESLLYGE
jgi:hypothetical protein